MRARRTSHRKGPYLARVVRPDLLLLRIEPHALGNNSVASVAKDMKGHFKADDEDALIQLSGALAQRVLPTVLVERPMLLAVEVGAVVKVVCTRCG